MQIFVFFYIIEQAIKRMRFARRNVLTEDSVSPAESQCSLDSGPGQVHLFIPFCSTWPRACRRRQGPSPLLSSWRLSSGQRAAARTLKVQKARRRQTALATPWYHASPPSSLEKSCSGTSHPLVSLARLECRRRQLA